jgi:hypothetical protein
MDDFEKYRSNLNELIEYYQKISTERLNEAQTRFHLIDRLFFDCLDWLKVECQVEERQERKFADYTFKYPHRCLIVEAKREGLYFELPVGWDKLEYRIESLTKDNPEFYTAINQAMDYCQNRGVQIGAVCNGFQIVVFLASRYDGIPPIEGNAIVFDSLEKIHENFLTFWNLLSKNGILQKRIIQKLSGKEIQILPKKLSSQIGNYPGYKRRNELQTDLQILSEVVLEDVMQSDEIEEEFVKHTYCSSGALSQYALISKDILEKRYALLFNQNGSVSVSPASTKKGVNTEKLFGESLSKRPILLIGDVGSGKSMFIKYLKNVVATDVLKHSYAVVIDLGTKAALQNDLNKFVVNEIKRIFLDKFQIDFDERNFIRGVYHAKLEKFSKGIYSDLKDIDAVEFKRKEIEFLERLVENHTNHLHSCFDHIVKGRNKQIVLFIDNVDQREIDIQEKAFLIANEISNDWPATVFLTLRPTTFYKSKKIGSISGYHPKVFTISPPRVDDVIIKRLGFAIKITSGFLPLQSKLKGLKVNLDTLTQFLEILKYSFDTNTDLKEFIDNITYGNIRQAIEFLSTFIGSGHIDTHKIILKDTENQNGKGTKRYNVALHEFIRAIIFKDNHYFNPSSTEVSNLFDISSPDAKEHFQQILLLDYFLRYHTLSQSEGFHSTKKIVEYMQNFGYNIFQIEFALKKLANKKMIENETREELEDDSTLPEYFRVTSTGAYHIRRLLDMFVYLDAILVDTPILDDEYRDKIKDVSSIEDRIERGKLFVDYLDKKWDQSGIKISGFDWKEHSEAIKKDVEKIHLRQKRD